MHLKNSLPQRKRFVIIAGYLPGESYGLLGPQMAATIIEDNTDYDCIVIACTRDDDKKILKTAVIDMIGNNRPIVAFSTLGGREDLFSLAKEFTDNGAFTILAGPQANVDFVGEKEWSLYDNRFTGLSTHFTCAAQGPAEQCIPLLRTLESGRWQRAPGILYCRKNGSFVSNMKQPWNPAFLSQVRWNNLYRLRKSSLEPIRVSFGQVVQQLGCPHALQKRTIAVPYPTALGGTAHGTITLPVRGCSFCDVAVDKGYAMALDKHTLMRQIHCLPEQQDGRKIPFELINENPLPGLPAILNASREKAVRLSQINLTMRADWFIAGEKHLRTALSIAQENNIRILLGSMGFESFDDTILKNLNKGVTVQSNLRAIELMRNLKRDFPRSWGYSREDGAVHGFIHPTPWDSTETTDNNRRTFSLYNLPFDILPEHSIPLIIHHASVLGDWIREIEQREGITFKRYVNTIGWWEEGGGW